MTYFVLTDSNNRCIATVGADNDQKFYELVELAVKEHYDSNDVQILERKAELTMENYGRAGNNSVVEIVLELDGENTDDNIYIEQTELYL